MGPSRDEVDGPAADALAPTGAHTTCDPSSSQIPPAGAHTTRDPSSWQTPPHKLRSAGRKAWGTSPFLLVRWTDHAFYSWSRAHAD
eukprot:5423452-Amphidinium_carterae.1